jgi:hypothetical protein
VIKGKYHSEQVGGSDRWGCVAYMGKLRSAYTVLVRKLNGGDHLARPRHRRECNFKMNVQEIGLEGVGWIYVIWSKGQLQAVLKIVMNLSVP